MFEIAFALGTFSYSIFFLGLLGLLYKPLLIVYTLIFWLSFMWWQRNSLKKYMRSFSLSFVHPLVILGIGYITLQACINFVGLFGPEISFDATWYHLTLPKLYLLYHSVLHFPGGVLYYSDMPHLTEMLYTVGLAFGSDFFARFIHFLFGILTCFAAYKIARKFFSAQWAILVPIIFYSSLVVGWESISGYIDLSRAFFTSTALLAFLQWRETKDQKHFIYSGLLVGLTVATKLLSLWDIGIYCVAIFLVDWKTLALPKRIQRIGIFLLCILVCLLPWMSFSFIHTGNPIFPLFTSYGVGNYFQILNPIYFLTSLWGTFAIASDPINPIFLAVLPFILLYAKRLIKEMPLMVLFALGGLLSWYLTPQTGGGRYILPYIPFFAVVCVFVTVQLSKKWQHAFLIFIFCVAGISLVYRGVANAKFFPVIFHKQSQAQFMASHLQYNLGDFYDIDGWFAKHIKPTDTVLLFGFHNLYYVNFPFILSDWVKPGDKFTYIAVQGNGMPDKYRYWNLIYFNSTTRVRVYSLFGKPWYY